MNFESVHCKSPFSVDTGCQSKARKFLCTAHQQNSAMGSAAAFVCNPRLRSDALCVMCLSSNSQSRTGLRVNQRNHKLLGFSSKRRFTKFSRIVCSAIEDVTEEQRKIGSGLNGASAEEKLGKGERFYLLLLFNLGFRMFCL